MIDAGIIYLSTSLGTGLLVLFGLCVRYSFYSKCVRVKCCCIELERDVNDEYKGNPEKQFKDNENKNNDTIINI